MAKVDLHIHSTASDGHLSPAEIIHHAAERGLSVIALTDHDSVDGITSALAAAKAFPKLKVIPGVEISTEIAQGDVHVLGYFIDYTDRELQVKLAGLRDSRLKRAKGMLAKLKNLGIHIDWERVREIAGTGSIGRPHIAQIMLEKGYITSLKEAFDKYIGRGGPAYVEREKMTPAEAVELILKANGLPVLAHPFTANNPERLIVELMASGLIGIEAYYKDYTADKISSLVSLADKYGLIATGGSDYHGLDIANETMIGGVDIPMEAAEQLIALAKHRALKLASI
ncbi:3',5'-nucleoside bisphosphate phosphatase [subsurface metagenome]